MEKKKIIIIGSAFIGIILCIVGICISFSNRIKIDNSGFLLKENLEVEVYSKVKVSDFLESIEGKIIKEESLSTKQLGKQEVSFIYLNKENKKRKGIFTIEVQDKTEPLIWLGNSYRIKVGSKIDLEKQILCADNYDKIPKCSIKGEYDLNKEGSYKLEFEAIDSSNNQETVEFTLYVYEPKETSNASSKKENTMFSDVIKKYKTEENEIGIDVSKWQEEIDFQKVKEAGASFVMIRLGYQNGVGGKYVLDPNFNKNIEKAILNDLKVGVYFYSYANSEKEAKKQAQFVLKNIKEYSISLPIAFDWECYTHFNSMEISLFGLNAIADAFLSEIEKNKQEAMIYASKNYLNAIWTYQNYDVWLAHYTENTDYDGKFKMWQLCENGKIDGIATEIDIDILYK